MDPEFDRAKADVATAEGALEQYLREMKRKTGINDLKFWGTNKVQGGSLNSAALLLCCDCNR